MRSTFWSYYPLSADERAVIGSEAIIALDANALLHVYRLSPSTAEQWLTFLERLGNRVWVPHQAALEYQRNRLEVLAGQARLVTEVGKAATKAFDGLRQELTKKRSPIDRSRVLSWQDLEDAIAEAQDRVDRVVSAARGGEVDLTAAVMAEDQLHRRVTELLNGRVGPAPDPDWLTAVYKAGKDRYRNRQPPGWADSGKEGDQQYGDLVLWMQLLDHVEELRAPAVLVTEERKEDWIRREAGRTLGPLPALREEFRERSGRQFWLYSVAGVLLAGEHFGVVADQAAIEDAASFEAERLQSDEGAMPGGDRLAGLIEALERFSDDQEVPDHLLRSAVRDTLASWASDEIDLRRRIPPGTEGH